MKAVESIKNCIFSSTNRGLHLLSVACTKPVRTVVAASMGAIVGSVLSVSSAFAATELAHTLHIVNRPEVYIPKGNELVSCVYRNMANEMSLQMGLPNGQGISGEALRYGSWINGAFVQPLREEILFRGIVQRGLLYSLPKALLSRIAPGKVGLLDTKAAKAARIFVQAVLFSVWHTQNYGKGFDDAVQRQLIACFLSGIGLGILKESPLGMAGALGAHVANNVLHLREFMVRC